ncbi:NAD(P)H-binding protein [Nocardia sp. NBC_00565]|uniref:NAD(P)H-binding protein n=1 Tax=Nocardia sp. NBC_00565 TaxID=2975993 RepID=UPI002E80AEBE|nr:NAD(P)H-binding protein [Nocardia sp. NBC_00565]WUC07128.1 NAD(P)H-binding protein [Nocardia sp. NBC_00565]
MIVVTGATGNIGRTLVQHLAAAGEQVTAVSRGNQDVALPDGVRHERADLADPGSLSPAVENADALFLLLTGPQLVTGPDPERFLDVAAAGGVKRLVLLSSQATGTRPGLASHARLHAFETAIQQSDLDWTILRPTGFFSNTFAWIESIRADGVIAAPFADVALPAIDPVDIAEVAANVLRTVGHSGTTYELTGPAAISPREQADIIAAALDTSLRFVELTREQARTGMLRFMPEDVADGTLDIIGTPTPTERQVSSDVERVLGRPATSYAEWAQRNRAIFG